MTFPVDFRTNRLSIREFSANDTETLFALTSDADVVRYLTFNSATRAEAQGMIDFAISSAVSVPRRSYALAIVDLKTGALLGSCGLDASDDETSADQSADLYVVLRRDRWGQGLATELLPALLSLAMGPAGFARVYGVVHPDNAASIHVLQQIGMESDGVVHDAFPDVRDNEGRWREGLRYAILRK